MNRRILLAAVEGVEVADIERALAAALPDVAVVSVTGPTQAVEVVREEPIAGGIVVGRQPCAATLELCAALSAALTEDGAEVLAVLAPPTDARFRARCLDAGVRDIVSLPVEDAELAARLRALVRAGGGADGGLGSRCFRTWRTEATRELANRVAHTLNNALTAILGHAEMLESTVAESSEQRVAIDMIQRACRQTMELSATLLRFGRGASTAPRRVDVARLVRRMGPSIQADLPGNVQLELDCPRAAAEVDGDAMRLTLALLALVENACEAMPKGGAVRISVDGPVDVTPGQVADSRLAPGRCVVLSVIDSGIGMSEQVRVRAGQALFSSKLAGAGLGLGLALVRRVVQEHSGAMQIESTPGEGATVRVYLPVAARGVAGAGGSAGIATRGARTRG
jgi:signal transduction histidine kinase